jgi:hypothetical protein
VQEGLKPGAFQLLWVWGSQRAPPPPRRRIHLGHGGLARRVVRHVQRQHPRVGVAGGGTVPARSVHDVPVGAGWGAGITAGVISSIFKNRSVILRRGFQKNTFAFWMSGMGAGEGVVASTTVDARGTPRQHSIGYRRDSTLV